MGKEGIPATVEKRLEACATVMEYVTRLGILPNQVFFDPLVLPIGVDENQGMVTIKTIQQIKERFPEAKTLMGLSNVSYGLPGRRLINRSFLLMAIGAGLDAALLDPLDGKMMSAVMVARLMRGSDPRCRRYMRAYRQGSILE
jgi:5-methyltetrahydrofolate--homocysteine methyltransferase